MKRNFDTQLVSTRERLAIIMHACIWILAYKNSRVDRSASHGPNPPINIQMLLVMYSTHAQGILISYAAK